MDITAPRLEPPDPIRVLAWYERAAALGDPLAGERRDALRTWLVVQDKTAKSGPQVE